MVHDASGCDFLNSRAASVAPTQMAPRANTQLSANAKTTADVARRPPRAGYLGRRCVASNHTKMRVDLWWDDEVDGSVDTSGGPLSGPLSELTDAPCATDEGIYNMVLPVNGDPFVYDTLYEFAAVAYDAHENASEVFVQSGWTPTADGEDGGP